MVKWYLDAELYIDGYSLFRNDRMRRKSKSTRSSGRVGIYIRYDRAISAETIFSFTNGVIESLEIPVMSLNIIFLVTYRLPDNCTKTKDGKSSGIQHQSTSKEFKAYLDELQKLLVSPPTPTPRHSIHGRFQSATRRLAIWGMLLLCRQRGADDGELPISILSGTLSDTESWLPDP